MSEIKHVNQDEAQDECLKTGILNPVFIDTPFADGSCFGVVRLAGLCPHCIQPIGFHMTNGGKLSAAKTLRLYHLFTGNVHCEDNATNAQINGMTGSQKVEFFITSRDEIVFREAGFSEDEIKNRLSEMKAKRLRVVK